MKCGLSSCESVYYRDYTVGKITFASGTIGTRGDQKFVNVALSGYTPIALSMVYVANSSAYIPEVHLNLTNIVCNFYRAQSAAYGGNDNDMTVRVLYKKA